MKKKCNSESSRMHTLDYLFLILVTMKLAQIGDGAYLSWWVVTAPILIPILIELLMSGCEFIIERFEGESDN